MKKNSFKKLVIFFSLAIIIVVVYFFSHSPNKKYSILNNELFEKSCSPLFFKQEEKYYDLNFNNSYNTRYNKVVLDEWYIYLEKKIKISTIKYFLLDNNAESEVFEIYNSMKNKKKFDNIEFNHLKSDKAFSFFEFIYFAKKIEKSSIVSKYSWNYNDATVPLVDNQIIDQLLLKYENSTNSFVKNRYWFQTIKAYFYSSQKENLIPFFEKTKNSEPKNTLYYRAISYCAGLYKQQNNTAKANYLYSIIFDYNPENRAEIANNFYIKDNKSFYKSLSFTKNDKEKIALWTLYGFRADKKIAIEEIYKLNPKSSHLDYLLPRLINDEEKRLNSLINSPIFLNEKKTKDNIDMDIVSLVNQIAAEGKTSNPDLWKIASGYLSIFYNVPLAKDKFETLKTNKNLDDEIKVLKLLCKIAELGEHNFSNKLIYTELDWLYKIKPINDLYNLKGVKDYCVKHMNYIKSNSQKTANN